MVSISLLLYKSYTFIKTFNFPELVQEAMLYVRGANDIEPSARLEDPKIIKDIANKCGMKTKIVSAPSIDETDDNVIIRIN